jgi:hypothetical protein
MSSITNLSNEVKKVKRADGEPIQVKHLFVINCDNLKTKGTCSICWNEKLMDVSVCPNCDSKCCTKCLQTYILSKKEEPNCFSCKQAYIDQFLEVNTSASFRKKELRDHLKELIWDRERSIMPSSLDQAAARLNEKKIEVLDDIDSTNKELNKCVESVLVQCMKQKKLAISIEKELSKTDDLHIKTVLEARLSNINTFLEFFEILWSAGQPINFHALSAAKIRNVEKSSHEVKLMKMKKEAQQEIAEAKFKYHRPCPTNDCRGYLKDDGSCKLCNTTTCNKCWATTDEKVEHKCSESDLETKKLIASSTKPCPKCCALIHRIAGCDHMFCPSCKTGFNWKTDRIIDNSVNTNPLAREWGRRNFNNVDNMNNDDDTCGQAHEQLNTLTTKLNNCIETMFGNQKWSKHEQTKNVFKWFTYQFDHFVGVLRNRINRRGNQDIDIDSLNRELRIRYLIKEIDEDLFKTQSLAAVRKQKAQDDLFELQDVFVLVLTTYIQETLTNFLNILGIESFKQFKHMYPTLKASCKDADKVEKLTACLDQFYHKFKEIVDYFNARLEQICKCHYGTSSNGFFVSNEIGLIYHPDAKLYGDGSDKEVETFTYPQITPNQ